MFRIAVRCECLPADCRCSKRPVNSEPARTRTVRSRSANVRGAALRPDPAHLGLRGVAFDSMAGRDPGATQATNKTGYVRQPA